MFRIPQRSYPKTDIEVSTAELADVTAFLCARFGDRISDVARLGAGEWSSAYAFKRDGLDLVVRFSDLSEDFAKDARAASMRAADLLIPRVVENRPNSEGIFCNL